MFIFVCPFSASLHLSCHIPLKCMSTLVLHADVRCLAHTVIFTLTHQTPLPCGPCGISHNTLQCVITETPRINPLLRLLGWAVPSSAPALEKTHSQQTTAPNRCPLSLKKGSLVTKSSQFSHRLKKVRFWSWDNSVSLLYHILSNSFAIMYNWCIFYYF